MPLKDLPVEMRPREKLLARGAAALSDIELLALLLRTGLPGKGVWQAGDLPPSLWYVTEGPRRNRLAPHPLINTERILEENPAARDHEFGPLAWWSAHATRETPMPVRRGYPHLQWGDFRDSALYDAAYQRRFRGRGA